MKTTITDTELKAFLAYVEGKSFVIAEVAAALNLSDEKALDIMLLLTENEMLDVTCTWVPSKHLQN
jgi:hypothetical protein